LLDLLIGKTVEIALEKGIIKSKTLIVDATHTKARYNQKSPIEFLREKSKNVRKAVYQLDTSMKSKFPEKNTSNEVNEELDYCHQLISTLETEPQITALPAVKEKLNIFKESVEDFKEQMNHSSDPDARIGHKTKDSSFFGYKTHLAMSDERIITAAVITTGEKSDGKYLETLIEKSKAAGIDMDTVIGDTAYSEKDNIAYTKTNHIALVSKLHPVASQGTRKKEFAFNKDAGMFVCLAGHMAFKKKYDGRQGTKKVNPRVRYMFDVTKCQVCPMRDGCYQAGSKTKSYYVTIKSTEHQEQKAFQETESFKSLAKTRYKIEAKHSELKNRHGYDTASSAGLFGMEIQGATTIFVVNLKRILKILNEKK
jgi:hypothetical protein